MFSLMPYNLIPILLFSILFFFFFFNDTATTEIYTLSLHDALPIYRRHHRWRHRLSRCHPDDRSEEHTSELQSRPHLVCRLLLEKKKQKILKTITKKKYIKKVNTTIKTKDV